MQPQTSQSGRAGGLRSRPPHRSGRARLTHPALQITASLHNKSSHPREPPRRVLTEPDVNVSAHPALPIQPAHKATANAQTIPPDDAPPPCNHCEARRR